MLVSHLRSTAGQNRSRLRSLPIQYRQAQTASAQLAEEPESSHASTSHTHLHRTHGRAHPRKGKGKGEGDYKFPIKGRNGGAPDPFEVLGLDRGASESEVKKQYYRLALLLHPDSSHPSSSPANFSTLHRAYTLLSKPSSRSSYLQTGYGWSNSSTGGGADDYMRAEAANRRRAGASSWEASRRSFRESEAGRGAWGGFKGGDGSWQPYDDDHFGFQAHDYRPGKREERYMSNHRFLAVMGVSCAVAGWVQYHRLGMATGSTRELLDRQHLDASHALAEARQEAALHGRERRERIRRRVREAEVLKEVEKMDLSAEGS